MHNFAANMAIVLVIGMNANRLAHAPVPKEDWRNAAAELQNAAAPDEPVVFYSNDPWVAPGMWYMCLHYYSPQWRQPWMLLDQSPSASSLAQLSTSHSLWMVATEAPVTGPLILPGWRVDYSLTPIGRVGICHMTRTP
jgi:hypothetical protein